MYICIFLSKKYVYLKTKNVHIIEIQLFKTFYFWFRIRKKCIEKINNRSAIILK